MGAVLPLLSDHCPCVEATKMFSDTTLICICTIFLPDHKAQCYSLFTHTSSHEVQSLALSPLPSLLKPTDLDAFEHLHTLTPGDPNSLSPEMVMSPQAREEVAWKRPAMVESNGSYGRREAKCSSGGSLQTVLVIWEEQPPWSLCQESQP